MGVGRRRVRDAIISVAIPGVLSAVGFSALLVYYERGFVSDFSRKFGQVWFNVLLNVVLRIIRMS